MLLNSFSFMVVVGLVAVLYVIFMAVPASGTPARRTSLANTLLLILSYVFFLTHSPAGAVILFGVTVVAYFSGLILGHHRGPRARPWLTFSLVLLALVPLLIFKYYNFVSGAIADALGALGVTLETGRISWIIPLGISFFTFQALGYIFDVYRGKEQPERNFGHFMLFIAFFPQIASGPISRAGELLPQIKNTRTFAYSDVTAGVKLLLWGYFLKAVFADRMAMYADPVFANYTNFSGWTCFQASIAYSLQIYGDFAGYSLMAIGVGRIFGFHLPTNFQRPYLSASVTEFWRRWHMSLSRWLRDYVYIPLGGSRCSTHKTYRNILATFIVSGIWHGANWTFLAWGAIHGVVQSIEKFFHLNGTPSHRLTRLLRIALTFLVVNFAWIFFRSPSIADGWKFIVRIFTCADGVPLSIKNTTVVLILMSAAVVLVKEIIEETRPGVSLVNHSNAAVRWATCLALILAILLFGVLDSGQFIYVNF